MTHYRNLPRAFMDEWNTRGMANLSLINDTPRYWWVEDNQGQNVIQWECRPFPGCDTLIVTTKVELREDLRGQGLGRWYREFRHAAYKRAGFKGELATVRTDNAPQNALMASMGAKNMGTFPSDFGGSYSLWLTEFQPRPFVPRVNMPAPNVDICGARLPYSRSFCERPLGHEGGHLHQSMFPIPTPGAPEPVITTTPALPMIEANPVVRPLPMARVVVQSRTHDVDLPPKKKYSHWK